MLSRLQGDFSMQVSVSSLRQQQNNTSLFTFPRQKLLGDPRDDDFQRIEAIVVNSEDCLNIKKKSQ